MSNRTWPDRLSIRHSDLRRKTVEAPLVVQFTTGLLPSTKRKGHVYIAFRVRGDEQSYTYEPENQHVHAYLEAISDEQHRGKWWELRADGREESARLSVLPIQRPSEPGGFSRERWGGLYQAIREAYLEHMGKLPEQDAMKVAMLAFADSEEARAIAPNVTGARRAA